MFSYLAQNLTNPLVPRLSPSNTAQGAVLFSKTIATVVGWLFTIGILAFIFIFLINAIKYIISQGDKNGVEAARNGLVQALVGLLLLFALFAILKLIENLFGVCILEIQIPIVGQVINQSCGLTTRGGWVSPASPGN